MRARILNTVEVSASDLGFRLGVVVNDKHLPRGSVLMGTCDPSVVCLSSGKIYHENSIVCRETLVRPLAKSETVFMDNKNEGDDDN